MYASIFAMALCRAVRIFFNALHLLKSIQYAMKLTAFCLSFNGS